MKKALTKTKERLINSPIHRPGLNTHAFFRHQYYRWANLCRQGEHHQPEIFGIGHFRTGTVSLYRILESHLLSDHEPDVYLFTKMWAAKARGELSPEDFEAFLLRRSNALGLQFECAGFLIYEVETLLRLFPKSKFLLTIREPSAWIASFLSQTMNNRNRMGCWFPEWYLHYDLKPASFHEGDKNSLYPIDALLEMWQRTHARALDCIPKERLLVVPTSGITDSLREIEAFSGLPPHTLKEHKAHNNQGIPPEKRGIDLSKDWLYERTAPYREQYLKWTNAQS